MVHYLSLRIEDQATEPETCCPFTIPTKKSMSSVTSRLQGVGEMLTRKWLPREAANATEQKNRIRGRARDAIGRLRHGENVQKLCRNSKLRHQNGFDFERSRFPELV